MRLLRAKKRRNNGFFSYKQYFIDFLYITRGTAFSMLEKNNTYSVKTLQPGNLFLLIGLIFCRSYHFESLYRILKLRPKFLTNFCIIVELNQRLYWKRSHVVHSPLYKSYTWLHIIVQIALMIFVHWILGRVGQPVFHQKKQTNQSYDTYRSRRLCLKK